MLLDVLLDVGGSCRRHPLPHERAVYIYTHTHLGARLQHSPLSLALRHTHTHTHTHSHSLTHTPCHAAAEARVLRAHPIFFFIRTGVIHGAKAVKPLRRKGSEETVSCERAPLNRALVAP